MTWEPLTIIAEDDPATCAQYARDKDLLDTPGWKRFKKIARRKKVLECQVNQSRLCQRRLTPNYMYGILVPRNHKEAMGFDGMNGNNNWREAELIELQQIHDYDTFKDKGKGWIPESGLSQGWIHVCLCSQT